MASIEQELWNIYTYYTLHGYPRDPSKLTGNVLYKICRDIMILDLTMTERPITKANIELIFSAQVSELKKSSRKIASSYDKENKLEYSDFLSCLMRIAGHCYPSSNSVEESMQQLLMDNILPFAQRRKPTSVEIYINQPVVEKLLKYYEDPLMELFRSYATASDQNSKKQNMLKSTKSTGKSFDDQKEQIAEAKKVSSLQNSLANHMGYSDFIRFSSDYGLSTMGLTILDLGDIYLSVIATSHFEPAVRKLNFKEFWESLVRCALLSFKSFDNAKVDDKIKGMFLHIWRHIQSSVKEQISGPGNQNLYKSGLLRGSQMLNERFINAWIKDGYRDYLQIPVAKSIYSVDAKDSKNVLHQLLNKSVIPDDSTLDNSELDGDMKELSIIDIGDTDDIGDDRITPAHLRALLKARPDIAQILNTYIHE